MHRALANHASFLILVHNHPSGLAKPSRKDLVMTDQLQKAGTFLHISILDHIIIGKQGEFSFRKNGLLKTSHERQNREPIADANLHSERTQD